MARCWPEEPDFTGEADAERLVWQRLRAQLPDEAALFLSVHSFGEGVECEADLVVAWPAGLAVLEVKGSRVVIESHYAPPLDPLRTKGMPACGGSTASTAWPSRRPRVPGYRGNLKVVMQIQLA